MRSYDALQLRVKMRKEVWTAEQHPVKENNIINFHAIKHYKKAHKEFQEAETISYAIPRAEDSRPYKQQKCNSNDNPANNMSSAKSLFLSGITARFSFGAEEKNLLSWMNPTPPYKSRKYAAIIISIAIIVITILAQPPHNGSLNHNVLFMFFHA